MDILLRRTVRSAAVSTLWNAVGAPPAGAVGIAGAGAAILCAADAHAIAEAIGLCRAVRPGVRPTKAGAAVVAVLAGIDDAVAALREAMGQADDTDKQQSAPDELACNSQPLSPAGPLATDVVIRPHHRIPIAACRTASSPS